jgi:hypothetical protein
MGAFSALVEFEDFGGSSVGFGTAGEELNVVLDVELFEKPEDALGLGSLRRSVAGDNVRRETRLTLR